MGKIKISKTKIDDLYILEPKVFSDERGYFMESYNLKDLKELGININFVQDNESRSVKGVLRGMHFQTKYPQDKLVRVSFGKVLDVAVDMRKNSKTYMQYESVILSDENKKQFYIPKGFAHGFLVLSDIAILNYKCSDYYYKEYDSGFLYNDKDININWQINSYENITLSDKDKNHKLFKDIYNPF